MIGHHDRARALLDTGDGVITAQHALDDHRDRRPLDQPFEFAPGRRIHHFADEVGMVGGARHRPAGHVDVENVRRRLMLLARGARRPAAHRRIDSQHQRGEAGLDQTIDQGFDLGAVRPIIKLKPLRRVAAFLGDILDQDVGVAGHHIGRAGSRRAARGGALAKRVEQLMPAGRRHHDRRRHLTAQERDAGVDRGDIAQDARPQPQSAPGGDIFDHADFVVGAAGAEGKGRRGHQPARFVFQGIEIDTIHGDPPT